ncbi:MAG: hypothetical protein JWP29_822 [Rhodoferax sp.]|nr:hypothetical protein [Rhodoferax sp.]
MNHPEQRPSHNEEPEITQEEDVPSDGRDHEGEAMMKEVKNDKLSPTPDSQASAGMGSKTPAGRSI